jgi:hypothetical protein
MMRSRSDWNNRTAAARARLAHPVPPLLLLLLLLSNFVILVLLVPLVKGQTASANSYAAAAPGSSSSVSSAARADEPGSSATVVAVGVAPSGGQRVVVDCRLAAQHASEELSRYCAGVPLPAASSSSNSNNQNSANANAADKEEARRWREAPACGRDAARGAKTVALDGQGRAWSREPDAPTGRLCAFRDELTGLPLPASAVAGGRQGQQQQEASWDSAPSCGGDPSFEYVTRDYEGRAWGWQQGASCAWRSVKKEGG